MTDAILRLNALPRWLRFPALLVLGGIAGLGQAPLDIWPATIAALAVLLMLHAHAPSARRAAVDAWTFGLGYFGFSLRWIVEPFLVDSARHGWMAPFALVLMAGGAAFFWALAAWVARRVVPQGALFFGIVLVWVEIARSLILTGFPWALLGHIWIPTGLAQLSGWGGPHLLTLLAVLAAWGVAHGRALHGLAILGALTTAGFLLRPGDAPPPDPEAPLVRIVQPNAAQHLKWDPAYRDLFLNRMVELTGQGVVPDLVVWPETAVPSLLNYVQSDLSLLDEAARGAPLVFGIQRRDQRGRYHNSLVVMGPGGIVTDIYDKQHLVPFGEFIPGAGLIARMGFDRVAGLVGIGFAPGEGTASVMLPGIGPAVPLICYEGIFAEEIVTGAVRPRLLMLITNDAWFGQAAGPYQHLAQARLRAIEQGLPMVRAANTGISAVIDPKGRILGAIALGEHGAIDLRLPAAGPLTPYARWSEWPFIGLLLLLTFATYARRRQFSD